MKNNLRLFLASLALVASFGTQLLAETHELAPVTVSADVEEISKLLKQISEQKVPSTKEALGNEFKVLLPMATVGAVTIGILGTLGIVGRPDEKTNKIPTGLKNGFIGGLVGGSIGLAAAPLITNFVRSGKTAFQAKQTKFWNSLNFWQATASYLKLKFKNSAKNWVQQRLSYPS